MLRPPQNIVLHRLGLEEKGTEAITDLPSALRSIFRYAGQTVAPGVRGHRPTRRRACAVADC